MVLTIQPLPTEVVNLIAAGEVIDSMAAVVRELVENSLDADANRIIISLFPEQWQVQVADNGIGMSLANLQLAASAHSTSKIRTAKDIFQISTLGFRGEALHSLAQLASLEISSRPSVNSLGEFDGGTCVIYNHLGQPIHAKSIAIAPGTIVTVSDLFETQPLRRQGISSVSQQTRSLQLTLQQIALCHPHVTWQIRQGNTLLLHINPGETGKDILPQIVRGIRGSDLQQLTLEIPTLENESSSLELVLGLPDRCHRQKPDWVKIAINGRIVKTPELEQTILSCLGRTCPRDRYPICFIHLKVNPDQIDWIRHPAKTEIYLHNITDWQEQIKIAIEKALQLNGDFLTNTPVPQRIGELLKASEKPGSYLISPSASEDQINKEESRQNLWKLNAIAQLHNTYIVGEHSSGVWLIEQHIAHERILYEKLCDTWQLVTLENPIILNHLSPKQVENLERINIEIESFGEKLWAIRNAPELLAKRDDCADAILELSKVKDLQGAQVATACRSAIRNGTPLNLSEMQTILDQWQRTRNPRTCPHGRPIYLSLEESSLARFFRRNWVIGKSHGI
jgi:DNA mismatch repair protein MutL